VSLPALAEASVAACREIQHDVLAALEQTRRCLLNARKPDVLVVAPLAALNRDSLLFDHLCGALDHMASGADAVLYLVGPFAQTDHESLRGYRAVLRVLVEPMLARDLGDDLPEGWTPNDFAAALETREIEHAYFLCNPSGQMSLGCDLLRRAYIRTDAVALSGGDPVSLVESLHANTKVALISALTLRLGSLLGRHGVTDICQVPCLRAGKVGSFARRHLNRPSRAQLFVLGPKNSVAANALLALAKKLKKDVAVVDLREPKYREFFTPPVDRVASSPVDVLAARLVVDLTDGDELAAAITEGALRSGIPVVRPVKGAAAVALQTMSNRRPATLRQLLNFVARALDDHQFRSALETEASADASVLIDNESGWNWLSRELLTSRSNADRSPAEVLFA
jgi:hypothetical protein